MHKQHRQKHVNTFFIWGRKQTYCSVSYISTNAYVSQDSTRAGKRVIRIKLVSDRVISGQHDSVRFRFRVGLVSGRVDFGLVYFWSNRLFLKRKMGQEKNVGVEFGSVRVIFDSGELQVNYFKCQFRQDFGSFGSDHSNGITFIKSRFDASLVLFEGSPQKKPATNLSPNTQDIKVKYSSPKCTTYYLIFNFSQSSLE